MQKQCTKCGAPDRTTQHGLCLPCMPDGQFAEFRRQLSSLIQKSAEENLGDIDMLLGILYERKLDSVPRMEA